MANNENLRVLTSEEAREIGKKGGIASGKARAERKKLRDDLIAALGAMKDGKTIQTLGIEAIIEKFISGDMQAFTIVRDTIGEKPTDKIEADVGITNINVKLDDDE